MKKTAFLLAFLSAILCKAQWVPLPVGNAQSDYAVTFIDMNNGFMISDQFIYKTTNGGNTWDSLFASTNKTLTKLSFPTFQTGYVIGPGYKNFYKTINAGKTWTPLELPHSCYQSIEFINGQDSIIQLCDTIYTYIDISFADSLNGYVSIGYDQDKTSVGDNLGKVLKTSDGGITWTEILTDNLNPFTKISALKNSNNVYVAGHFSDELYKPNQIVEYSYDSGKTWINITPPAWANNTSASGVGLFVKDSNTVCMAFDNHFEILSNGIYKEYDLPYNILINDICLFTLNNIKKLFVTGALTNFTPITLSFIETQPFWLDENSLSKQYIKSISRVDNLTGYMIGDNGLLFRTTNGGGGNETNIHECKETIFNIFPNPASDLLYISALDRIKSIEIYDFNGRLISTHHETPIQIHDLSLGNYLIKITDEKNYYLKKFIKE